MEPTKTTGCGCGCHADLDTSANDSRQRQTLWTVLGINFSFFVIEMLTGFLSNSMGLIADSLDMLADATVYGLALLAVGSALARKQNIARLMAWMQIALAIFGFVEVIKRFLHVEEMPDFRMMIFVSIAALAANATSLYVLMRSKNKEVHIKASIICSSNDVIVNLGVIVAGGLVMWLQSPYPDLVIGFTVFVLVLRGAIQMLKIAAK